MLRLRSTIFEGHKCSTGDLQHRQGFPTIFYLSAVSRDSEGASKMDRWDGVTMSAVYVSSWRKSGVSTSYDPWDGPPSTHNISPCPHVFFLIDDFVTPLAQA